MTRIGLFVAILVAGQSLAAAAEFKVGDRVFWKEGARASDGAREISIEGFAYPATVLDIQNGFLYLGPGWIKQDDALSADEAIDYFSKRIEQNPEMAALWNNRGRVWEEKKEYDKAIADYQEADKLTPGDAATHNNLGSVYHAQGQLAEAIEHFNAAIEAAPANAMLYYNRGRVNQDASSYAAAAKDFAEAIQVDPNYLPAYNNAAWLAATCPEEKFRNGKLALDYAERAANMTQGKVWEILDTLAAAQAENGDFVAATKTSQQALTLGEDAAVHAGVRDRMTLYQAGKPYRMPLASRATP